MSKPRVPVHYEPALCRKMRGDYRYALTASRVTCRRCLAKMKMKGRGRG